MRKSKMKNSCATLVDWIGMILFIAIAALFAGGWIANAVKLLTESNDIGMAMARAIGVIIPPFGVILGYI